MYFRPNHLDLETGKAYVLVLKNVDKIKHELEANEFVEKIFTRKVEVIGHDGQMLAEIKGSVSEVEVGPGGEVEWFVVPVQTGKNIEMNCALPGHKEAGMV
ncbi:MAG: biphenyl 2,3-dioxygenase, partial [Gammaproteobacteria bacterium]|nr:biphenyl 2,3-dioxygenase [Gammaproteobacteria bacterium]